MKLVLSQKVENALAAAAHVRSGSYIFYGEAHIGKATSATELARRLNCLGDESGECASCRRLRKGAFLDFITIAPEGTSGILISQIRALRTQLSLKPYHNGRRVVLIDGADLLTDEAQNALLKLIEEPPADTLVILATDRLTCLLPTVRSRCALIYFPRIPVDRIERHMVEGLGIEPSVAKPLALSSGGIPGRAITGISLAQTGADLSDTLATFPDASLFDRLIIVRRFLDAGLDPTSLIEAIRYKAITALVSGQDPSKWARRLVAVERLAGHLDAQVNTKIALERLAVEL